MSVTEPGKIITPWAESGLKNPIPPAANPTTGRAGFDQGFSAINMTAKEAGGIPPFGQDFNGIFYSITEILRYYQAGGRPTYSRDLATATGGYAIGAVVMSDDFLTVYRNTVANNTTNPNTGGAGWVNEQATETLLGKLKVATQAQTNAGSADDVAITPKKLRFGFSVLLENNGYIVTPSWMGGWMLAWGTGVIPPNSQAVTLTYALAFPTKVLGGGAFHNNGTVPTFSLDANTRASTTQVTIRSSAMTAAGAAGVSYIAIGY